MYSHEIETYLRVRNYLLKTPEEINEVTDIRKNPQVNWIKFYNGPNNYEMKTNDNYSFNFHILTIDEYAKECAELAALSQQVIEEEEPEVQNILVLRKCS